MNGNSTSMKLADNAPPSEGLHCADDGNESLAAASMIDLVAEQWDRITEKGTVLSRYTCSEEQLNLAICESQGDKSTNHLQSPLNTYGVRRRLANIRFTRDPFKLLNNISSESTCG